MDWEELGPVIDDQRERLGRLGLGDRFVYVFDFGDDWAHLCTVGPKRVDPLETLGIVPDRPLPSSAGALSPTRISGAGTATTASPGHLATGG